MLISSLDDAHVGMIVTEVAEGDAIGAWRILLRKYERNTLASKNQMRRELHSLKLGVKESLDEYKSRAMHIVGRLRSSKESVSDGELLYCLLEGLPVGYAMVKQAMEVQDISDVEEAFGHLREVEDRLGRLRVGNNSGNSSGSGNGISNSNGSGGGNTSGENQVEKVMWMSAEKGHSNRVRKCLVCGDSGHYSNQCSKRCHSGCYKCGGDHRVWECGKKDVESGDSDFDNGSFDSRGRRLEREGRPQTPGRV
jgi:hypothetical protein